jgi:membrane-associated phospholipid phosphatase
MKPASIPSSERTTRSPGVPIWLHRLFSWIAPNDDRSPQWSFRLWVFPLVFLPWFVLYEWAVFRGPQPGSFQTYLPGEVHWPIWQWTEIFYLSPYVLVTLAPLAARTNDALRRFVIAALLSIVAGNLIFHLVPAIAPPRPFWPSGLLGRMMIVNRDLDLNNGTGAFPSFHVVWSFLGAAVYARGCPRFQIFWWTWASLVSASCVLTGIHSLADVIAGLCLFLLLFNYSAVIETFRRIVPRGVVQTLAFPGDPGSPYT